jgi:hypothetical protein
MKSSLQLLQEAAIKEVAGDIKKIDVLVFCSSLGIMILFALAAIFVIFQENFSIKEVEKLTSIRLLIGVLVIISLFIFLLTKKLEKIAAHKASRKILRLLQIKITKIIKYHLVDDKNRAIKKIFSDIENYGFCKLAGKEIEICSEIKLPPLECISKQTGETILLNSIIIGNDIKLGYLNDNGNKFEQLYFTESE